MRLPGVWIVPVGTTIPTLLCSRAPGISFEGLEKAKNGEIGDSLPKSRVSPLTNAVFALINAVLALWNAVFAFGNDVFAKKDGVLAPRNGVISPKDGVLVPKDDVFALAAPFQS